MRELSSRRASAAAKAVRTTGATRPGQPSDAQRARQDSDTPEQVTPLGVLQKLIAVLTHGLLVPVEMLVQALRKKPAPRRHRGCFVGA